MAANIQYGDYNMTDSIDFEILDLGLVYYKNIIPNSEETIELIKKLSERYANGDHGDSFTKVEPWEAWHDPHMPKPFCHKFYIYRHQNIPEQDFYREDLLKIADSLYGSLDRAFEHYANELYPWAKNAAKSEEPGDGVLRYESDGGHLPAHQDLGVSSRLISTVSYLNDNYLGGEIEFRQSGVKLKPEAGSVVFFPSNFLYVHEIMPITDGTRFSMPHWFHHLSNPRMSDGTE